MASAAAAAPTMPLLRLRLLSSLTLIAAFTPPVCPPRPATVARSRSAMLLSSEPLEKALDEEEVRSERFGARPPLVSLLSPAKVNLFLRVVRRRGGDEEYAGYHELASLFQTVSLFDTLEFWTEPPDESAPVCSMEVSETSRGRENIPTDGSNLVMRAMKLFAERTKVEHRLHCRLHKEIPSQAGMGGGSSDAATALHAANRLAGFPVTQDELIKWGGELGSDVSFFLSRGSAYCTGRGEIIDFRDPLPPTAVYLVKPSAGLSTPRVFKQLGLKPGDTVPGRNPLDLLDDFESPLGVYEAEYVNDLETPAFKLLPMLKELRDDLSQLGFQAVMMSGSGTTIFCIGPPFAEVTDTWQGELKQKYDVEIFEELFCRRLDDEKLWYAEQPEGAELTNIQEPVDIWRSY